MADVETGHDTSPTHNNSCYIQWSRINKTVKVESNNSGLLRSSISAPSLESSKAPKDASGTVDKVILNSVSGYASPGEILALMGPSGSGKTSLLDALSGRSVYQGGVLAVNGIEAKGSLMKKFRRKIAYVKQSDLFFSHLTVRDQLTYTALLRLPSKMSKIEKHAEVDRVITMLRLSKSADTAIQLLSGGEKKRVNIGTELLTDPSVILLDEPTSGLDSTSAVSLLRTLHILAKKDGKTIITSIHQPSSAVFRSFDKLLMLADGNTVYFGDPISSLSYLSSIRLDCPDGYNAADHWMDVLVVDSNAMDGDDEDEEYMVESAFKRNTSLTQLSKLIESKQVQGEEKKESDGNGNGDSGVGVRNTRAYLIECWDADGLAERVDDKIREQASMNDMEVVESAFASESGRKYNTSWWAQFLVLSHRALSNSKSAIFTPLNLVKSAMIGLMMGLLWFQLPYTEKSVADTVSYYFFTMTYWVFDAMFQALMSFPGEKAIIFRERASGSYHLSAYFLSKCISDAPTRMTLPLIYMVISYWLAGINNNFGVFLGSTGCSLLAVLAGESWGLMISAAVPDLEKAMVVMVVVSLTLMVLGGFFVQNIPSFLTWLKFFSPFKYAFDASQQLVFNKPVPCDGSGILEQCKGGDEGFVSTEDMIEFTGAQGSVGFNVGMLIVLFLLPRYIAFLYLKRQKPAERS